MQQSKSSLKPQSAGGVFQGLGAFAGGCSKGFHRGRTLRWLWKNGLLVLVILAGGALRPALGQEQQYDDMSAPEPEKIVVDMVNDEKELRRQQMDEVMMSQRKDLAQAMAHSHGGRWTESIPLLESIIAQDPTVMISWNLLGHDYMKVNRWDDAIKLWDRLRTIRPDYFPVYNWMGRAYMLHNEYALAIKAYRTSLSLLPTQDREFSQLNLARMLRWSGNLEAATALLRPLHKAFPQRLDVTRELGSALISNREFAEALPLWTELRTADPTNLLFQAKEAVALLNTGHPDEAMAQARQLLAGDAYQMDALLLMANYMQYHSSTPEEALPWLQRVISQTTVFKKKRVFIMRYVSLYGRMHEQQPELYPLDRPAAMVAQVVQDNPNEADVCVRYVELLMGAQRYAEAREELERVLNTLNRYNTRANNTFFELALLERKYQEGWEHLQQRVAFNPNDPYLHYQLARWYAAQTRWTAAHRELDQLEAMGQRGAVAVLLYHGLSASDNGEVLPASRLREHLQALKDAGFRFISANELPGYFAKRTQLISSVGEGSLDRVACVTFDDARRDAMRYGTPLGQELRIPFSMHIPVGFVLQQHPFICTWDQLREYQKAGCWIFGGHTMFAHERTPVDEMGRLGFALANHIWLDKEKRVESNEEYRLRLENEYTECHRMIAQTLGRPAECNFFAYPFGDLGQITCSNDRDAPRKNLEQCARAFAVGFIQTDAGYAVASDNPLLYQRYEPDRTDRGADVVAHVLERHPVNMARKLRAEFAALEDKRYLVLASLRALQQDGYPLKALDQIRTNLEAKLGRRIPLSDIEKATPTPPVSPTLETPQLQPKEPLLPVVSAEVPRRIEKPPAQPDPPAPSPAITNAQPRKAWWSSGEGERLRDLRNPLR